uniref:Uncharacterized protein MANES_06G140400 n=1 Tax=Rhizophora mucronata TaxID=61149 RepID=A0A2P2KJ27_RHIMU
MNNWRIQAMEILNSSGYVNGNAKPLLPVCQFWSFPPEQRVL